jgi:hypothetical protein
VPDAQDAADEAAAEEDEDSSSDDGDMAEDGSWQQMEYPDEEQLEQADDDAGPAESAAAADGDEASEQLPMSVVEALQSHKWRAPDAQRQQLQQQKQQAAQQSTAGAEQQPQQQQQQQQRSQQQQPEQRTEPLRLSETNPMYLPVLTDEDLDNDPPGHKSGYVAVIGRPNAGEQAYRRCLIVGGSCCLPGHCG